MTKKLKGKEWYKIFAPKFFGEKIIGETPVGDPEMIKNRVISVSPLNLINDPSKYYLKFKFKITELNEKKTKTEFWGLECLRDYITRMIRHGVLRIDDVVDVETKDNKKLRIKTITLISNKATKEVEVSVRKFFDEKISEDISKLSLDEFLEKILNDSIKRSFIDEGSKIYPVYNFEIRRVDRLK